MTQPVLCGCHGVHSCEASRVTPLDRRQKQGSGEPAHTTCAPQVQPQPSPPHPRADSPQKDVMWRRQADPWSRSLGACQKQSTAGGWRSHRFAEKLTQIEKQAPRIHLEPSPSPLPAGHLGQFSLSCAVPSLRASRCHLCVTASTVYHGPEHVFFFFFFL